MLGVRTDVVLANDLATVALDNMFSTGFRCRFVALLYEEGAPRRAWFGREAP